MGLCGCLGGGDGSGTVKLGAGLPSQTGHKWPVVREQRSQAV